jgi:hypothetical protein
MAENNITAFTINTLLIGLLALAMVSSYVLLVNNEGREEIFDGYPDIETFNLNLTNSYTDGKLIDVANVNSNLTANYNPEVSISAADQSGNAIAINLQSLVTITWTSIGILGALLFGTIYTAILSTLIISIIGYLVAAYFIKFIRTGQ